MRIIILIFTVAFSLVAQAESYTQVTSVKAITLGSSIVRVKLEKMKSVEGCINSEYYYLDPSVENNNYTFSMLLSAKATKEKLFFQLHGCSEGNKYAKISHVYLCDTMWCK